jgi:NAD(P)-dependent dehydrogenase (short-subunit alcohol dehydrogenase family)
VANRLAGHVALVTGGASGIGRAIAQAFATEGAAVAILDINMAGATSLAATITGAGGRGLAIEGDVGNVTDVDSAVATVVEKLGSLSLLVNNAGIILQAAAIETTDEQWSRVLTTNLTSCFMACRAAAKKMIEFRVEGRIVNVSSIHATLSEPNAAAYTAAKGGMEAFSRTLATELAPYRIRVNCLAPGATYTDLTRPMYTEAVKHALHQRIPLREIAEPEWIANGAVFLASDESRYMTGQVLTLDGGYVMDGSLPGASYWRD